MLSRLSHDLQSHGLRPGHQVWARTLCRRSGIVTPPTMHASRRIDRCRGINNGTGSCCHQHRRLHSQRPRDVAERELAVKNALKSVTEPYVNMSIVSIGAVENVKVNEGSVTVTLNLLVPGLPSKDQIIADCDAALQKLDWVETINVRVQPRTPLNQSGSGVATTLKNVEHVIGVSSCKGGVGKSTVAVNLAVSLAQRGLRVGLLDADVYGPSLPHMLDIDDVKVRKSSINPRHILPIEGPYGLKVMSFGWVNPGAGVAGAGGRQAAILRGPVVTRVINQLVCATEWADIDYLVVDMPPGTGDVQITLAQILPFTGAVIVSTPHRLSLVDAAKGVQMFESLRVPCLAVVENMSYFECRGGERHYPFGRGGRRALIQGLLAGSGDSDDSGSRDSGASGASDGSSSLIQRMREVPFHHLPLTEEVSGYTHTHEAGTGAGACATNEAVHDHNGDGGGDGSGLASGPVVIRQPDSQSAQIYNNLGADVMNEIFKLQINAYMIPTVTYMEAQGLLCLRYFGASSVTEHRVPALELRLRDPDTGDRIPSRSVSDLDPLVRPVGFDNKGNYGLAVSWSDGHYADIFAFETLKRIAEECSRPHGDAHAPS